MGLFIIHFGFYQFSDLFGTPCTSSSLSKALCNQLDKTLGKDRLVLTCFKIKDQTPLKVYTTGLRKLAIRCLTV